MRPLSVPFLFVVLVSAQMSFIDVSEFCQQRSLPGALDSCGQCELPADAGQACRCTPEQEAMRSCIPCPINSTAINTGVRLCVPNDASVTLEPGPYLVFDIEVDLVYETFTTIPNVTYPGHLDPEGRLLDCFCQIQECPCCCKDPNTFLDECGLCVPMDQAGRACNCTASDRDSGRCIQCPLQSSSSTDSVRLCHPVVPGVYEIIDVNQCFVRDQFQRFPGTVYPGYFGVDAQGMPLALDCFCQPPPTTTSSASTTTSTTPVVTSTTTATTTSTTTATTTAEITTSTMATTTSTTTATTTTATTTTPAPTTPPPVLPLPPNQVPPVLDRPPFGINSPLLTTGNGGGFLTTSGSFQSTTTAGQQGGAGTSAPSAGAGQNLVVIGGNMVDQDDAQTDLLAVIAVPSAVLAATIAFLAFQLKREASPKFYPQTY